LPLAGEPGVVDAIEASQPNARLLCLVLERFLLLASHARKDGAAALRSPAVVALIVEDEDRRAVDKVLAEAVARQRLVGLLSLLDDDIARVAFTVLALEGEAVPVGDQDAPQP